MRTLRHSIALVALAAAPALADDADACQHKRDIIRARARHARDHVEYERLLRAVPRCEPPPPSAPIEPLPPVRDPDVVDDVMAPGHAIGVARVPAIAPATPDPDPEPIVTDDTPPVDDEMIPEIDIQTPFETRPVEQQPPPAPLGKPPLSAGRIAGEALAGSAGALAGVFVGALIGYGIDCGSHCGGDGEFDGLAGLIIGGALGGELGLGLGVWAVGSASGQGGSLAAAIGGAFIGSLGGGLAAALASSVAEKSDYDSTGRKFGEGVAVVAAIAGPIGGAILAFNLTRHYDEPPQVGSLLRFDHGNLALGVPIVTPLPSGGATLSIAGGRF